MQNQHVSTVSTNNTRENEKVFNPCVTTNPLTHYIHESLCVKKKGSFTLLLANTLKHISCGLHCVYHVLRSPPMRNKRYHNIIEGILRKVNICLTQAHGAQYYVDMHLFGSAATQTDLSDSKVDVVLFLRHSTDVNCAPRNPPFSRVLMQEKLRTFLCLTLRRADAQLLLASVHSNGESSDVVLSFLYPVYTHPRPILITISFFFEQRHYCDTASFLKSFLDSNESVSMVIVFLKGILKVFCVPVSDMTPYVLTLMVVAFARHCSHSYPPPFSMHYPCLNKELEVGYLVVCFLSFFSPLPRGIFYPERMRLVASDPNGILYDELKVQSSVLPSNESIWRVMDPICPTDNVARECVTINKCRKLFEYVLQRLLNSCGKLRLNFPPIDDERRSEWEKETSDVFIDSFLGSWFIKQAKKD